MEVILGYVHGVGDKALIKGYGTIDLGNLILKNFANVPDIGVNLISVKVSKENSEHPSKKLSTLYALLNYFD